MCMGADFQALDDVLDCLPTVADVKKRPQLSRVQRRLIEPRPEEDDLVFQHSVFCQTGLPYRDPGEGVRLWERRQGAASIRILAGEVADPKTQRFIEVGLPWGPKPRLVVAHINAEALRQGSNVIEIEDSLSAFVKRIRGFTGGREIRMFKDQLSRLSASLIRIAFFRNDHAAQIDTKIIAGCELWLTKDERQRVLWPSTIALSLDYYESLQAHAVPLCESDLAALAHSAVSLDLYAWLAQRLHRIDPTRPQFISWAAVKEQFGADYKRMNKFKEVFRVALRQVLARYRDARLDVDERGLTLAHSPPPVRRSAALLGPSRA
jgi:replication initiator protein